MHSRSAAKVGPHTPVILTALHRTSQKHHALRKLICMQTTQQ